MDSTYLRLSIEDACNLRCRYCRPERDLELGEPDWENHPVLPSDALVELVAACQRVRPVRKLRLTGGEPLVRKDVVPLVERLRALLPEAELCLTSNGVLLAGLARPLRDAGLDRINLSLDTLDREKFKEITRRDRLEQVFKTFHGALELGIPLKVNSVVMEDTSDDDIASMVGLARLHDISLRFIEQMPFSGKNDAASAEENVLIRRLERLFPELEEQRADKVSTARSFKLSGFAGTVGIIEGRSRKFCSTCNKVRVTPQGMLKACLYDKGVLDLRSLLRDGTLDNDIVAAVRSCLNRRYADGHETETSNDGSEQPSMATIGG